MANTTSSKLGPVTLGVTGGKLVWVCYPDEGESQASFDAKLAKMKAAFEAQGGVPAQPVTPSYVCDMCRQPVEPGVNGTRRSFGGRMRCQCDKCARAYFG
jgi:hypothetical protein